MDDESEGKKGLAAFGGGLYCQEVQILGCKHRIVLYEDGMMYERLHDGRN